MEQRPTYRAGFALDITLGSSGSPHPPVFADMETSVKEIVDYWVMHKSEVGMSVDWAEATFLCWRCAHKRNLQRCHIIPRSLGGTDEPSNLVLLCGQCHAEAPNVADPEFMWHWLKAHAVPFYGTYWQLRGLKEYELIFGKKPFEGIAEIYDLESRLQDAARLLKGTTSTHWGQGKLNPSTVAWLIYKVEQSLRGSDGGASNLESSGTK